MKVILFFVGNTRFDSRSQKFLGALQDLPVQISVCELSPAQSTLPFMIKWPIFIIKSLFYRFSHNFSLSICLDVFSIPAIFFSNKKVVFDARELNDRVHSVQNSKIRTQLSVFLESVGFKKATLVTTVNNYLANSFKIRYQKDCFILLNLPFSSPVLTQKESREQLHLPMSLFIWVFQGNLQKGRGVEKALEFIMKRPEDEGLLFIGSDCEDYELKARSLDPTRIYFTGQVPALEVLNFTVAGNAGLMLIETSSESYLNSLPNKFFEYLTAGLPVLTTPLPQAEKYINEFRCGIAVPFSEIQVKADLLRKNYSELSTGCQKLLSQTNGLSQIRLLRDKLRGLL